MSVVSSTGDFLVVRQSYLVEKKWGWAMDETIDGGWIERWTDG